MNPLALPNVNVTVRPAVLSDIPFMDALQKLHTKQVGWMPTKQFEGKIALGHVLIAEESGQVAVGGGQEGEDDSTSSSALPPATCPLPTPPTPVGYLIGNDQYFKRDDVGIIYQLNVLPGKQRGLIGATLLKAQFERSAYGCRLYCCWCAQDIAANRFWEAMGFVPLAFRTGSEKKARTHIFWQKRIRAGDTGDVSRGGTAWWFPSQTTGGSIRADRIVLPIPPGTHWSDAKPMILPGMAMDRQVGESASRELGDATDASSATTHRLVDSPKAKRTRQTKLPPPVVVAPAVRSTSLVQSGFRFGPPVVEVPAVAQPLAIVPSEPKVKTPKPKNDPRLVAAARELRDRWLEQVNASPLLPTAKYDVSRAIEGTVRVEVIERKRLAA